MDNREQAEFWNGSAGERWVRFQPVLDRAIGGFGVAAMDCLPPLSGQRVLDVGCGCGATSFQLAQRVGAGGHVCGLDISAPMLEFARTRAAQRAEQTSQAEQAEQASLDFVLGDASTQRFDTRFDVVFSRFGVMFFADPGAAFSALHAALVPAGRLAFVCWREIERNPWALLPVQWVRTVVPETPAPASDAPGPYSMADGQRVTRILERAGFVDIALRSFETPVVFSTGGLEQAVDFASAAGPASRLLQTASEPQRSAAVQVIREQLALHLRDGAVALPGSAWLVTAAAS